jgi:hypothetical protein
LTGEIIVSQVRVCRYVPYSDEKNGHIGKLFVTNFKVSFVTLKIDEQQDSMVCFTFFLTYVLYFFTFVVDASKRSAYEA